MSDHELTRDDSAAIERLRSARQKIIDQLAQVIVGQTEVIEELLISLFSRGHCLLEGVPGLAKTLMISTLSRALNLTFSRIQFTPDLMPADITGTEVIEENRSTGARDFRFLEGPLFSNVILADEINRTPPKTQAALLEAMQERQVTVGRVRHKLADPFFVLATQNPIEQEGTYPLPEAQQDRFMFKVFVRYPSFEEEFEVARRTTTTLVDSVEPVLTAEEILDLQRIVRQVPVSDHVIRYALALVRQTRVREQGVPDFVEEQLSWGAGPRARAVPDPRRQGAGPVAGPHPRRLRRRAGVGQARAAAPAGAEFHRRERRRYARRPDRADPGDHPHPRRRADRRCTIPENVCILSLEVGMLATSGARLVTRTRPLRALHAWHHFSSTADARFQEIPASRGDQADRTARTPRAAHRRGLPLRHAPQSVLRPVGRVPPASPIHLRRRSALRRLEGLGQAGPLLRQTVRGRHEPSLHVAVRRLRAACATAAGR